MFLTVFTPAYNRGYVLSDCYESLKRQTCSDFEWIIVDDGSTDDTRELVDSFIREGNIKITYMYQENSGKHIAHNAAAAAAKGELFVCVDSDDMLTDDAVETARDCWEKYRDGTYAGILAKRGSRKTGEPICGTWPGRLFSATMFDLGHLYGFSGDTALFFRTSILKNVRFKQFRSERFMPELNLYYDIDAFGEMILMDKVVYLCEYLPDGLTAHYFSLLKRNPKGTADTYYKELCLQKSWRGKVKCALLTNMYLSITKDRAEICFSEHKTLLTLTAIPAVCMRNWFFRKLDKRSL